MSKPYTNKGFEIFVTINYFEIDLVCLHHFQLSKLSLEYNKNIAP